MQHYYSSCRIGHVVGLNKSNGIGRFLPPPPAKLLTCYCRVGLFCVWCTAVCRLSGSKAFLMLCSYSCVGRRVSFVPDTVPNSPMSRPYFTARVGLLAIDGQERIFGFGTLEIQCSVSSSMIHTFSLEASSTC